MSTTQTELTAGRELDVWIATTILGCDVEHRTPPRYGCEYYSCRCEGGPHNYQDELRDDTLLRFSDDITGAWPLAERYSLTVIPYFDGRFLAGHYDLDTEYLDIENGVIDGHFSWNTFAVADTAPLAICLALLSAAKAGKLEKMARAPQEHIK